MVACPRSASYVPLIFGGLGLLADVTAELILVVGGVETYITMSPFAFALTGGVANGLYTICGIGLTLATPLTRRAHAVAAVMWGAGVALSVGAFLDIPVLTAGASALLFALFCPWCVYLAVRFR